MMSMCRVVSYIVGRGCLLWPVHFLGKTLLVFAPSFRIPRPDLPVTPGVSWLPTFAFQSPIMKEHLFWVLVLKGLVGLHRTVQLQLLQHYWPGIDLHYHDIEWFALEMYRDHSVIFEIAYKYCILDSFVEGERGIWKSWLKNQPSRTWRSCHLVQLLHSK